MKTKDRPFESHLSVINSFLSYANIPEKEKSVLQKELENYMRERILNGKWCHPFITKFHTDWYREFYRLVGNKDPYEEIKNESNEKAKQLLNQLKFDNIHDILKLSIIGNKIDFGSCIHGIYDLNNLKQDIISINNEKLFIDDTNKLIQEIKNAKNVFFLFDNNGELILDIPFLKFISQYLPKEKIFLVGKESPMLNDVTINDLFENNINKFGRILSIGSNCFGLHEEDVSSEFKRAFREADLVIAKGQAYFEFFSEYNFNNVFNILRVKQEIKGGNLPILNPGMNLVVDSKRYTGQGMDYKWD